MANIVRIAITNTVMGGDYTGVLYVGPKKKAMNVILDTGSSALALDGKNTRPILPMAIKPPIWLRPIPTVTAAPGPVPSSRPRSAWERELPRAVLPAGNAAIAYRRVVGYVRRRPTASWASPTRHSTSFPDAEGYLAKPIHVHPGSDRQTERPRSLPDPTRGRGRDFRHHFVLYPPFLHPCGRGRK